MEIFELGELFDEVQSGRVLDDGKTFVDCTPLKELSEIRDDYEEEKKLGSFNLKDFILRNFKLPPEPTIDSTIKELKPIKQHIQDLWKVLRHQPSQSSKGNSLIDLKFPYIVPGGRFREIYYWDSYFTMLGLSISGEVTIIQSMVDNFAFLIDKFGYIPNGNRTYFIGRSQPPFFACMVQILASLKGDDTLIKYLSQLVKEHSFWMSGLDTLKDEFSATKRVVRLEEGFILNRYWDDTAVERPESFAEDHKLAEDVIDPETLFRNLRAACESGWDFSTRWLAKKDDLSSIITTELIPIDLNCILYQMEKIISKTYSLKGDDAISKDYNEYAERRKAAINRYCWNASNQSFCDYNFKVRNNTGAISLAMVFPLFFNIASQDQAEQIVRQLKDKLLAPGGFLTTNIISGQQWDAPNGWAPLQWIAISGLLNYDHKELANEAAHRWVSIVEKVYLQTGKLMEKYNVVDLNLVAGGGEYPSQDGFGWTNGVYLALKKLLKENK